jgi:phospholipase C
MRPNCYAVVAASLAAAASAGSLKDIKHIVLFMQENRAFDHVRLPLDGRHPFNR